MLKLGELNNCEKCYACYSTYDNIPNNNWKEFWRRVHIEEVINNKLVMKKPKGLCQFCNPKSKYYNK